MIQGILHAPSSELFVALKCLKFPSCPSPLGKEPTKHKMNSHQNSSGRTDSELTSQIVVAEVDLCHRIAELANVRWKLQPRVSFQLDSAVLDEFPAHKSNRNFA